ncbi:hypothetical protein [Psychroserpens sp.]|uniref:hypothetical protein n=2 Tax=Psychroserpens sp. TaxID=2020870 RepID=UPI003C766476
MKKTIILIGLIIGMNLASYSQEVTLSKSELENVLCKQWEIEYAMMNGMKIGQMPGAADFDIKFKSDGEYDLIREDGNNESGIWTYDAENKYVELSIKEKSTSRIKSIDKGKLILTLVSGQNDPPGLPSVEIHFKPM